MNSHKLNTAVQTSTHVRGRYGPWKPRVDFESSSWRGSRCLAAGLRKALLGLELEMTQGVSCGAWVFLLKVVLVPFICVAMCGAALSLWGVCTATLGPVGC